MSEPSPVDQAIGAIADPKRLSLIYTEAYARQADFTQECLNSEGFSDFTVETWPAPRPEEFVLVQGNTQDLELYGYGISVTFRSQLDTLLASSAASAPAGLNASFFANLDEQERRVFARIINRCQDKAWEAYPLPESYDEQLAKEVAELRAEALQSVRIVDAWSAWSTCMRREGYEYRDRSDATDTLQSEAARLTELLELIATAADTSETEPSVQEFYEFLDEFEKRERAVVTADVECAKLSQVDQIVQDALVEAELAWLRENGDRIALIRADRANEWFRTIN